MQNIIILNMKKVNNWYPDKIDYYLQICVEGSLSTCSLYSSTNLYQTWIWLSRAHVKGSQGSTNVHNPSVLQETMQKQKNLQKWSVQLTNT